MYIYAMKCVLFILAMYSQQPLYTLMFIHLHHITLLTIDLYYFQTLSCTPMYNTISHSLLCSKFTIVYTSRNPRNWSEMKALFLILTQQWHDNLICFLHNNTTAMLNWVPQPYFVWWDIYHVYLHIWWHYFFCWKMHQSSEDTDHSSLIISGKFSPYVLVQYSLDYRHIVY